MVVDLGQVEIALAHVGFDAADHRLGLVADRGKPPGHVGGVELGRRRRHRVVVARQQPGLAIGRLQRRGGHAVTVGDRRPERHQGHLASGQHLLQPVQHRDRRAAERRRIVAAQHAGGVAQRADHGYFHAGLERQHAVVLQQHQGFLRRIQCQLAVGRAADGRRRHRRRRAGQAGQVAHAIARREQPHQRAVDVGHRDQLTLQCFAVAILQPRGIGQGGAVAFVVHARAHGGGDRGGGIGRVMVVVADVLHRIAVGNHVAGETPRAAQVMLQQQVVGAGGLAVDAVVGAHDRAGPGLGDRRAKGRQVGVDQVVLRDENVGLVPGRLGAVVHGEMLGRGDDLGAIRVGPLHALDEGHAHARGEERILAIGFLAAAPARVAEDVEVGRPGVEPGADAAQSPRLARQRVQPAHFGADRRGDALDQRRIEAGA